MKKLAFNEADLFLVQKWNEARDLEKAMAKVREKYREMLQEIGAEVLQGRRNDLDVFRQYDKQKWATDGFLLFGCKDWVYDNSDPSGFWFQKLSLDYLTSGAEAPEAFVLARSARKAGVNVVAAKERLWKELPRLLGSENQGQFQKLEDDGDCLIDWSFSSKEEILSWIVTGETQKLAECIQKQVAIFVKLLPVLNKVLQRPK